MASGKAHARASLILAIPAGVVAGIGLDSVLVGLGAAVGSVLGIALTPDLDQEHITYFEWKLMRKTGPLAFLWMLLWSPYSLAIPHRSRLSHFPILGTFRRLLYIVIVVGVAWLLLGRPEVYFPVWLQTLGLGMVIGLVVSDIAHWIMDF